MTTNLNAIGNERTSDEIANSDAHRVSAHVSGAWGPSIALPCIPRPRAGEGSTDVPETRRRMTNPMAIDHNIDKRTDSDAYFVILIPYGLLTGVCLNASPASREIQRKHR